MKHRMRNGKNRMAGMLAICGAIMIGALALTRISGSTDWGLLLFALCPAMHIIMHRSMHTGHQSNAGVEKAPEPMALLPMPEERSEQLPVPAGAVTQAPHSIRKEGALWLKESVS